MEVYGYGYGYGYIWIYKEYGKGHIMNVTSVNICIPYNEMFLSIPAATSLF
jgi:hypothetical protein